MIRAVALPALLLAGCAAPPVSPPAPAAATSAPTIVSLNPCADAILAEVAAPGQLLALSHYSHDPAASSLPPEVAARYRVTGGTAEEVLALGPQVVVADSFIAPAMRSALERGGVRVEVLGIANTLDESLAQVEQLAQVTGHPARGQALARRIVGAWDAAAGSGPRIDTLLWQEGGLVPGEGSLAHALLAQSGLASHSAARGLGQGAYLPLEQVLVDPPQLVIAAGDERMQLHPVLRGLRGTSYRRLDPALLYCGGPTIPRALAALGAIRESLP